MLKEPKLGGNPKGNYEEEARVPRGFPEEPSRATFFHKPPILLVIVRTPNSGEKTITNYPFKKPFKSSTRPF